MLQFCAQKGNATDESQSVKQISMAPILQRPGANGQVRYQIAVMIEGKRIRERSKTLDAAEERATQIRNQYREEGKAAFALPPALRIEAHKCAQLLEPQGATLPFKHKSTLLDAKNKADLNLARYFRVNAWALD
jgi:hypothetical protein